VVEVDEPEGSLSRKEGKRARRRAKRLLFASLTPKQRRQLKRKGYFQVCGSKGNLYRIASTFPFNVRLAGFAKRSRIYFCLEAEDPDVPVEDVMLAQKLLLESEEGEFLRLANMTYIPRSAP
jgi:hypothetical protein